MSLRSTVTVAVVIGAMGFAAGRVWSQDAKPAAPSPEDMMKAMAEMAAPAEQNKELATSAGTWDSVMKMWMDPSAPPIETKGVSTRRAALNGLYVFDESKSDWMGSPFEGFGVNGYSKEKGKYFAFWCDTMGTTPMMLWGTADASGKTITFDGELYECAMGNFTPRIVIKNADADHQTMEMYQKQEGATEFTKVMEGSYTRRK